jgi:5'-nucleotidase (lipoprotein e(P4) family)
MSRGGLRALVFLSSIVAGACTSSGGVARSSSPAPLSTTARALPNDVRWFRNSAEYRALTREVYSMAAEHLPELSRGLAASSWAVILDADETVLDNSEYQRRRAVLDSGYTEASWAAWVGERAATAVPGAVEFTKRVHTLGGRVAIVTNRAMTACDATRTNLKSLGVDADLVLCQPQGESDKNPRFERVRNGTAAPGVPALTVVAWVGDNIQDFPNMTQAARNDTAALSEFGKRYFVLPNPMYGSWQQVREP